jgi:hypothetical protein
VFFSASRRNYSVFLINLAWKIVILIVMRSPAGTLELVTVTVRFNPKREEKMMKRFCSLLIVVACCIACGCDNTKTTPPAGGGSPSTTTEGTGADKPKEASNTSVDADTQMVKVSLSVPNMT